jgi:hypothetical protein
MGGMRQIWVTVELGHRGSGHLQREDGEGGKKRDGIIPTSSGQHICGQKPSKTWGWIWAMDWKGPRKAEGR